jgi:DNA-binding transcriptional LysR family regulator
MDNWAPHASPLWPSSETAHAHSVDVLFIGLLASSLLVLTTGRQYCERFTQRLPVKILACPVEFPRLMYYQLWHERTHSSSSAKWLRERIKSVASALRAGDQLAA